MSSDGFEFDEIDLGAIDAIESHYTHGTALPPRTAANKPGLVQRDLFGAPIVPQVARPVKGGGTVKTITLGNGGPPSGSSETRAKTKVTKRWDPASFAKHGWSKKNAAVAKAKARGGGKGAKGKSRPYASDEDAWDEEEVLDDDDDDDDYDEFLLDTTYDPNAPILPIKWPPDDEAVKTFVYPVQADKPLRVYQYNIVQSALYKNTLVSLPTGLGKTFIAACVMLNFYRWYPRGKVLFLAPTRPLVTQQIKACHYIAGIPQEDSIELTGGTIPKLRSLGWATKRVIYSTPQTVERDLAKGRLDPRDVTLVVVDEAHRASGDYSYCGVVRYLMCRNPHFRVLALTATPGSRGEAVQEVINNLHIGHIEVRADDSIDIRQYVHKKSFDLTVLPLGPALSALRDKWAGLMRPYIGPLLEKRLIYSGDAVMLSPFAVQQAYQKIKALPGGSKSNGQYFPMIKTLAQMCRAMEYLIIQSVTSFDSSIKDIQANGAKKLVESSGFRQVLNEVAAIRGRPGYVGHPKMEKLRSMCLEHFESTKDDVDEYTGEKRETRVMIFCNFRAVVEEIVDCLNTQRPLIKATPFVGQASSKGAKGKSQKEQLETIRQFKKGTYNVLVATSIGEEGLDIGEIDLIICYEANKSPIRMLQRVGRTGRARDGHIIVLMSEGREERNWDRANEAYAEVQNALTSNKIFELYADCERLLPSHVKPVCEKVQIKALPLTIEAMTMNGQSRAERKHLAEEKKKSKTVRDPRANMPTDAFEGFRSAGQLAAASKAKPPTTSQTLRERKAEALLDADQEENLRTQWMFYDSGEPVIPRNFNTDELPFQRHRGGSAQRIARHGQRHLDLLSALRTNEQLADGRVEALDIWTDRLSTSFKAGLVDIYKREDDDPPPRQHKRLLRTRRAIDEDDVPPALQIPALTGYPLPQPIPEPTPARHCRSSSQSLEREPLFRPSTQEGLRSKRSSGSSSPRPNAPASKRPRLSSPARGSGGRSNTSFTETIDLSGIVSTDEEDSMSRQPSPVPAPADARPASPVNQHLVDTTATTFDLSNDDDQAALDWSDTELLKGAVIRGKSLSMSPAKLVGSANLEPIVIEDSDEENGRLRPVPPAAPRKPLVAHTARPTAKPPPDAPAKTATSRLTMPARTVSAPSLRPGSSPVALGLNRTKSLTTATTTNAGTGPGFKPFVPPRPSTNMSKPHQSLLHRPLSGSRRVSSPPLPPSSPSMIVIDDDEDVSPARKPSSIVNLDDDDEDDEYGSFDLPPEAFDDLSLIAISQVPPAKIRGQRLEPTGVEEEEDSIIMPPPPPSTKRPLVSNSAARNRIVDDSDCVSSPASARTRRDLGFRTAKHLLPPELVAHGQNRLLKPSEVSVHRTPLANPVPMRRMAVPDSSSSGMIATSSPVVAKGPTTRTTREDDDELSMMAPSDRGLNRLRRGKRQDQVVIESSDPEQEPRTVERHDQEKMKKMKKKKPILTHKLAAKFGVFDTEAINSSASGSEASSEEYDSENSIDREFVVDRADEDEDGEEEGHTFYRDSLNTQMVRKDGTRSGPVFETEPEWVRKNKRWADPENWGKHRRIDTRDSQLQDTPRSQEPSQWSYDSFCVPDDEEIEYDDDSQEVGPSSPA